MRMTFRQLAIGLAVGPLLAVLGCSGDAVTAPSTGSVEVTTATVGPAPDVDGYTLSIDGATEVAIAVNDTHRQESLEPGSHSIRLAGMAANCTVEGDNPRTVNVQPGSNATVGFTITCGATTGSLGLTVTTGGSSPDADGYTVTVDGAERGTVAASGGITLEGLAQGDHLVGLNGLAGNCQVQGENPRTTTVSAAATASVAFEVSCAAAPANAGSIRITTTTTGSDLDPDGYAFAIDGGSSQPIGVHATATSTNAAAGSHRVRLSKLANNCTASGANPRSVTVATGATVEVSFAVVCSAASGTIQITTTTTGASPDPDGYTVAVDNATPQGIGVNATLSMPGVSVGPHQVNLAGLASNCRLNGANPRSISVVAAATTTVLVTIDCPSPVQEAKIAFTSWARLPGNGGIYVVNPDGTELTGLTPDGTDERHPVWSPDRTKIAFFRDFDLYTMTADGGNRVKLTSRIKDKNAAFAWSPDGTTIAFEADSLVDCVENGQPSHCSQTQIWTVGSDGSNARKVIAGAKPSWAPDGHRIAFQAGGQIHVVNADGSGDRVLTNQALGAFNPAWSPTGSRIAFEGRVQRSQEVSEIFGMNEDGSAPVNLTTGRGADMQPVWSPDGRKIALVTYDPAAAGTNFEVAVMNADGTGRTILTHNPAADIQPGWSPDATRIVFVRNLYQDGANELDLFVVKIDGSGETNITKTPELPDDSPSWASR